MLPGRYYPNHIGVDQYHRYEEDIALFAEMGFKCYRMSISWSRLFLTGLEAEPNPARVEHHRHVFQCLRDHGIEPLVTVWTTPPILSGFLNVGWQGALWQAVELVASFFIYLPFARSVDKDYLAAEEETETA